MEVTNKLALRIGIANTHREVIDLLKEQYGGSVELISKAKAHHKQGYLWRAAGSDARRFLAEVEPYLIIKKPQVAVGKQFRPKIRGHKLTDAERRERERLRTELRGLNHRGIDLQNPVKNESE